MNHVDDIIDWQQLAELRDEIGADDFAEVVALFLEEAEEVLPRALTARPPWAPAEDLAEDLHLLKGLAMNIGFSALAALCQEAEALCAAGRPQNIDHGRLRSSYAASKTRFLAGLPRLAAQHRAG